MILTYSYRIKDSSSARHLERHARAVNFVWNFTKSSQIDALKKKSAKTLYSKKQKKDIALKANWLDENDYHAMTKGAAKELGLHSQTVQAVYEEYITRRQQFKKLLRWRGKHSLGWIPFKKSALKFEAGRVRYCGRWYKTWHSRDLPEDSKITNGSFAQDSRGRWYINITFKTESYELKPGKEDIGVDLGIKDLATLSNGIKVNRPDLREKYLEKIRKIERTRRFARRKQSKAKKYGKLPKAKQLANLAAKTANRRKDHLHKESRKIVEMSKVLVVGDLKCRFMNRNKKLSGISLDTGIGMFKAMMRYKAIGAGVSFEEISERDSTQTCASCGWKHPPERRIGLGVREWTCPSCSSYHDRDHNAARNILRMGHHTLTAVH